MNNTYTLHTCGARGTRSVGGADFLKFGGQTTCYILKSNTHAIIVDCGTGLYLAHDILKDCTQIDILITHLHYDHILGLLDWSVFPTSAKVTFYGTFSDWGIPSMASLFRQPFWPVSRELGDTVSISLGETVTLFENITTIYHASTHPNDGNIIRVNLPNCSVCFAFDYEHTYPFDKSFAAGCSVLLYDGTYDEDEDYAQHKGWGHSTWQEGCNLGEALGVSLTLISHHSPHNNDAVLLAREQKAKALYKNVRFARFGDALELK